SKYPEHLTINLYDLNAQIFGSNLKEGKWEHNEINSLLSTNSCDEYEAGTWLDDMQKSSTTLDNIEYNVEPEIDLIADGFLVVLVDLAPDGTGKNKDEGRVEEIQVLDSGDDKWPTEWP
ncbi:uncharacterized protein F5147DRAFT_589035, partial [Suillus discolor]